MRTGATANRARSTSPLGTWAWGRALVAMVLILPAVANGQLLEEPGLIGGSGTEPFEEAVSPEIRIATVDASAHGGPTGLLTSGESPSYNQPLGPPPVAPRPSAPPSVGVPMPSQSWLEQPAAGAPPLGPGSYVPEPPHERLARAFGQGIADLFEHPPVLDHDLLQPLLRESWLFRPYSAGFFMGMASGSTVVHDWASLRQGFLFGYRMGWDVDDFWGLESRLAWSSMMVADSDRAIAAQIAADNAAHMSPTDPFRQRFDHQRDAELFLWDVDLLYYPTGDAPLRPYVLLGLGYNEVYFLDRLSAGVRQNRLGMPLALGWKWRTQEWLAWRFELGDNLGIAFGGDRTRFFHALDITLAAEIRFGGTRKAYWPWNPGRTYW